MRFMRLLIAAALAGVGLSGQAHAAKVIQSGTINPGDPASFKFTAPQPWVGTSLISDGWISFRFSRPVTGSFFGIGQLYVVYYDENGHIWNDDNGDFGVFETFSGDTFKKKHFFVNFQQGPHTSAGAMMDYSFTIPGLTRPIKYTVTAINAGAVPEPATWALMILGMGAVGAALRGRRGAVGVLKAEQL